MIQKSHSPVQFSSVLSHSRVQPFATPWTAAHQESLSITKSQSLLIESVMPSNHLILCHPLLLLPSIFLSIMVFSNESALHIRWPNYWSFSFSINHSNEYSGLISFGMVWFGYPCWPRDSQESSPTPQFKSINSLALSFLLQSNSHTHTWLLKKNIALTRWTSVPDQGTKLHESLLLHGQLSSQCALMWQKD